MPEKENKPSHYNTSLPDQKSKQTDIDPCAKFVVDNWDSFDDYWSSKFAEFDKFYDQWIGKKPQRDETWQAQFHKRLTWQAEKTLVARFHSALFPTSAPIDTETTQMPNELLRIFAKSIVVHWFKIGKFSKEFLSGMRSAAIYGTGLFEDDWYVRTEMVSKKVETQVPDYRNVVDMQGKKILDEQGNVRMEEYGTKPKTEIKAKREVVEDRYRVKKANIYSWRVHPYKLDDDDDYPAIKQEFVTYEQLLERQVEAEKYGFTKFDNMDKVQEDKSKVQEDDAKRLQKEGEYIDIKNPRIELLSYWGLYSDKVEDKDKATDKKPMWIMVANKKYVLRKQENPYWHKKPPLFHIIWHEDEKPSYYGIGIAQTGKDAEDRANLTVNIRTDVKNKNLRGGGRYNALDKKLKKSQLQSNVPGLWKACTDINAAYAYDVPPSLSIEDYKEEEIACNDHREITGSTSSLLPTEAGKGQPETFGGMQQNLAQAMSRLKPDLAMMEMMGIRKMADRGLLLTRQFMSQPEAIELMASEDQLRQYNISKFFTLTPKDIIGSVKFFATGLSESLDKMQNIEKMLKYIDTLGKMKLPPDMLYPILLKASEKIALWLGFEDAQSFIPKMPMQPQGMPPQQMIGGVPQIPQGMPPPMPPQGMPAQMMGQRPMLRPPMGAPAMPQGGMPQNLPPQVLQMIISQMMQRQGGAPPMQ